MVQERDQWLNLLLGPVKGSLGEGVSGAGLGSDLRWISFALDRSLQLFSFFNVQFQLVSDHAADVVMHFLDFIQDEIVDAETILFELTYFIPAFDQQFASKPIFMMRCHARNIRLKPSR